MRLLTFGGMTLPTTLQQEVYPVNARDSLVTLRDGAFDQDGTDLVLTPYAIERNFDITDGSEHGGNVDGVIDQLLAAAAGGRRILKALMRDGVEKRQTFAKLLVSSRPRGLDMDSHQPMTARFQIDYPYWLATDDEPHYLDNGYKLDAGWTLDGHYENQTLVASPTTFTISNDGLVPVRRGLLVITPTAGAVAYPRIYNAANGMWLQYNGSIPVNDTVTFDLLPKSAKYNWATDAYGNVTIGPGQMEWMTLERGDNAITFTCIGAIGSVTFEWHWSRHYL